MSKVSIYNAFFSSIELCKRQNVAREFTHSTRKLDLKLELNLLNK